MTKTSISKRVTATILSMSLLTVMAGAAIAPALGIIKAHFCDTPALLVQFIVSMPALLIIFTNFFFQPLSRRLRTRAIATTGLLLYVVAGAGCFFVRDIWLLLAMRALLGISVGLIMPLSTGLLSYYFPPEEQARLMGLSAAMNQMGGVVATLLAGLLATIEWNYAFLVYLLGLVALTMVWLWLPDEQLGNARTADTLRQSAASPEVSEGLPAMPRCSRQYRLLNLLRKFHPSVVGMLLLMTIFFVFPTNFAIVASHQLGLSTEAVTIMMVGLDIIAFFVGLVFGSLMNRFRLSIKYFAPIFFLLGYAAYLIPSVWMAIVGSVFIGIANGVGVPYLNTIASIKGGRDSATTVMPLLSAALYLGQFISPIVVLPLSHFCFGVADQTGPYKVAILLCFVFIFQVFLTRHFQSLPPTRDKRH